MYSFKTQDEATQFIDSLPRINLDKNAVDFLIEPKRYKELLLEAIANAEQRISIVALYFENDEAGNEIFSALYRAKKNKPSLEIFVCVDWHRAQRGRIGANNERRTNSDWYCELRNHFAPLEVPVYGIPINTRETLGVLHFKGAVIDDKIIFTGASINNVYLYQQDKYRLDRYHVLSNRTLADSFYDYIIRQMIDSQAAKRLDCADKPKTRSIKKYIKQFRKKLARSFFEISKTICKEVDTQAQGIEAIPIVGVGATNDFNKLIEALVTITQHKIVICTPYFNLPPSLLKIIKKKLKEGIQIEIIVGDKTANDFYIPDDEPFNAVGTLPFFYEINLLKFMKKNQQFCDKRQLSIYLWKDKENSYHLKGLWVDDNWMLITGNNLNPRAWRLDLENGILLNDPNQYLAECKQKELNFIHQHTTRLESFTQLDELEDYPYRVKKLIRRLKRLQLDKLINRVL